MPTLITKSQLQKNIGVIGSKPYTVINHGKPEAIIFPYFEGCEDAVEDFIETCEMLQNQKRLQKEMQKSLKSGASDLVM